MTNFPGQVSFGSHVTYFQSKSKGADKPERGRRNSVLPTGQQRVRTDGKPEVQYKHCIYDKDGNLISETYFWQVIE
jgi:hypothetical protein